MAEHRLKTDPEVFCALAEGRKTYEIRRDDRGFRVGDTLVLCETVHTGEEMARGEPLQYTGRTATREITHILKGPTYGLADGWAILSVNDPEKDALAAHVGMLRGLIGRCTPKSQEAWFDVTRALAEAPTASLARRQAEAVMAFRDERLLPWMDAKFPGNPSGVSSEAASIASGWADELRRQAEEES